MSKKSSIELILESLSILCDEKDELKKRVEALEARLLVPIITWKPNTQPYWNPGRPSPYTITCTGTYKQ